MSKRTSTYQQHKYHSLVNETTNTAVLDQLIHSFLYLPVVCFHVTPCPPDRGVLSGCLLGHNASLLTAIGEVVVACAHVVIMTGLGNSQRLGVVERSSVIQL